MSDYYRAGRIQEIADYCVSDVINTYRLWLRHELFKGKLDGETFELSDLRQANEGENYAKYL